MIIVELKKFFLATNTNRSVDKKIKLTSLKKFTLNHLKFKFLILFRWMYVERKRDGGQSYDVLGSEESLTRKFKSVEPSDYGTMEKS